MAAAVARSRWGVATEAPVDRPCRGLRRAARGSCFLSSPPDAHGARPRVGGPGVGHTGTDRSSQHVAADRLVGGRHHGDDHPRRATAARVVEFAIVRGGGRCRAACPDPPPHDPVRPKRGSDTRRSLHELGDPIRSAAARLQRRLRALDRKQPGRCQHLVPGWRLRAPRGRSVRRLAGHRPCCGRDHLAERRDHSAVLAAVMLANSIVAALRPRCWADLQFWMASGLRFVPTSSWGSPSPSRPELVWPALDGPGRSCDEQRWRSASSWRRTGPCGSSRQRHRGSSKTCSSGVYRLAADRAIRARRAALDTLGTPWPS